MNIRTTPSHSLLLPSALAAGVIAVAGTGLAAAPAAADETPAATATTEWVALDTPRVPGEHWIHFVDVPAFEDELGTFVEAELRFTANPDLDFDSLQFDVLNDQPEPLSLGARTKAVYELHSTIFTAVTEEHLPLLSGEFAPGLTKLDPLRVQESEQIVRTFTDADAWREPVRFGIAAYVSGIYDTEHRVSIALNEDETLMNARLEYRYTYEPTSIDPEIVDPETVDPETVDPETVDPETVDPETVDPEVTDPETVEPVDPETEVPLTDGSTTPVAEAGPGVLAATGGQTNLMPIAAGVLALLAAGAVALLAHRRTV